MWATSPHHDLSTLARSITQPSRGQNFPRESCPIPQLEPTKHTRAYKNGRTMQELFFCSLRGWSPFCGTDICNSWWTLAASRELSVGWTSADHWLLHHSWVASWRVTEVLADYWPLHDSWIADPPAQQFLTGSWVTKQFLTGVKLQVDKLKGFPGRLPTSSISRKFAISKLAGGFKHSWCSSILVLIAWQID